MPATASHRGPIRRIAAQQKTNIWAGPSSLFGPCDLPQYTFWEKIFYPSTSPFVRKCELYYTDYSAASTKIVVHSMMNRLIYGNNSLK